MKIIFMCNLCTIPCLFLVIIIIFFYIRGLDKLYNLLKNVHKNRIITYPQ